MANPQMQTANGTASPVQSEADFNMLELGDLNAELQRLSEVNQELLEQFHEPPAEGADADAVALRLENAELRGRVEDLEQLLAAAGNEELWVERQREYEALLE